VRRADPDATKPEDWDEEPMIDDPEDVKPEGYDDIPEKIPDPEAEKPEDWDDEDDGEWEAPMIDNPEFKGEWSPKRIDNPNYKGKWSAPEIDNPEYEADDSIGVFTDLKHVGFELWQVKAGSLFDNIMVTDSPEEAKAFAEATWGKNKDAEKAMFDEAEAAEKAKEEEVRLGFPISSTAAPALVCAPEARGSFFNCSCVFAEPRDVVLTVLRFDHCRRSARRLMRSARPSRRRRRTARRRRPSLARTTTSCRFLVPGT